VIYAVIFLIIIAAFFWIGNFGLILFRRDWPLLIVLLGIILLIRVFRKNSRKSIINKLAQGQISPEEAVKLLKKGNP